MGAAQALEELEADLVAQTITRILTGNIDCSVVIVCLVLVTALSTQQ